MITRIVEFDCYRTWLLNANDRSHWARKAADTKRLRQLAWAAARGAHIPPMDRARCTVTITWRTDRRRDPANLYPSVKAWIDGIVDAHILPDDDQHHLEGPDMRANVDPTLDPKHVHITITLDPWENR